MSIKGRRVVTGFNKDGKSCIKWDSEIEPVNLRPGFDNIPMWATRQLPAESTEEEYAQLEVLEVALRICRQSMDMLARREEVARG